MQAIPLTEDIKNLVESAISSYEAGIQSVESILEPLRQTLEPHQNPFLETKQEQESINSQLRENLAKNNHLRRKDFDQMMQGVFSSQDEREKAVRNLLVNYLDEQKRLVNQLRDSLIRVKDAIVKGEINKIKYFQDAIKDIFVQQEKKKAEVTDKLNQLQNQQDQMLSRVKALLAKGNQLRIKDFKGMLKEFTLQRKERIHVKQERRERVHTMLADFKKRRLEWRANQTKTIPPITNTPKT